MKTLAVKGPYGYKFQINSGRKQDRGPNTKCRIIIMIIIIQFNSYLFTCQLNSSMANYKVSMNVIKRQNINTQGQNVAAKKQLKFKYISNWNNNNNNNK
jgi:hypothetical protein